MRPRSGSAQGMDAVRATSAEPRPGIAFANSFQRIATPLLPVILVTSSSLGIDLPSLAGVPPRGNSRGKPPAKGGKAPVFHANSFFKGPPQARNSPGEPPAKPMLVTNREETPAKPIEE